MYVVRAIFQKDGGTSMYYDKVVKHFYEIDAVIEDLKSRENHLQKNGIGTWLFIGQETYYITSPTKLFIKVFPATNILETSYSLYPATFRMFDSNKKQRLVREMLRTCPEINQI